MPESIIPNTQLGVASQSSNTSQPKLSELANLQLLLAEVTALANQLRKPLPMLPRQGKSPPRGLGILQTLGRLGPQTVPDIARAWALSRQNIQILVNRLEFQGYVVVTPNPSHKRSGLIQLTDRGRLLLASVMQREATSLESLLPFVTLSRIAPAAKLLRQLRRLLAGKDLRPAKAAGEYPALKPARTSRRPARRRKPVPATAELPVIARKPIEPDEGEFPVNLL